jgi:hypothetical protein
VDSDRDRFRPAYYRRSLCVSLGTALRRATPQTEAPSPLRPPSRGKFVITARFIRAVGRCHEVSRYHHADEESGRCCDPRRDRRTARWSDTRFKAALGNAHTERDAVSSGRFIRRRHSQRGERETRPGLEKHGREMDRTLSSDSLAARGQDASGRGSAPGRNTTGRVRWGPPENRAVNDSLCRSCRERVGWASDIRAALDSRVDAMGIPPRRPSPATVRTLKAESRRQKAEGRRQKAEGRKQKGFALLPLPAHSPESVIIVLPAFRLLLSAFCFLPHFARLFVIFVRYSFALATAAGTSTVRTFRFRIRTRPSQIVATTLLPEAAYTIADSTE